MPAREMTLVNFHLDDSLLQRFDEKARQLDMTRTQLLTALVEMVVRILEEADFAEKTRNYLSSLTKKGEPNLAKSSALTYAEAYKRAKKAR